MEDKKYGIKAFAGLYNGKLSLNGKVVSASSASAFEEMMDEFYRSNDLAYPKFHKMDDLSKLGFLTAEIILKDFDFKKSYAEDRIGVVLSNRSSSLDTDIKYNKMLGNGIASPAVFVYTLPNILIGEICIRNKIKGESVFFVSDEYQISNQVSYIHLLLESGIVDVCIGGWVELIKDSYRSFIYLVTNKRSGDDEVFSDITITKMFKQI
jgi:hypothetical protein